ncbi:enoyl-CoA hydratase/isomerase family protein [Brevibacterium album]|uniref:enoyl-CoA hydratase/isomerase family protein n=1 Tax=Brevibacterium album TaxID=417948 RepID=UPI00042634FC|nr:enoyl-CoA hydratase/isomerase family protein [Brevibacterium album]
MTHPSPAPAQTPDSPTLYEVREGVAVLTLNRPHRRNAFTRAMLAGWAEGIARAAADPEVRALLVTGAGKGFCAGVDLDEFSQVTSSLDRRAYLADDVHAVARALEGFEKPYIAAINGDAIGAGMDMALMADIRLIGETARLSQGYVRVGLVPGDGGAHMLPRIVGEQRALELMWTGRMVPGPEAVELGIALEAHPTEELFEAAFALAARLAAGPPAAIRTIKRLTRLARSQSLTEHLVHAAAEQAVIQTTEDSAEAQAAFREKRTPVYRGR